jgi:hypothetical protein
MPWHECCATPEVIAHEDSMGATTASGPSQIVNVSYFRREGFHAFGTTIRTNHNV